MAQVDKIFTQAREKWDLQPFSDLSTTSSQPKPCRDLPRNVPTVVYSNKNPCIVTKSIEKYSLT